MEEDGGASYVGLNIRSLCDEYPEIEGSVVNDVYFASDKDCEKARTALSDMCGRKRTRGDEVERGEAGFELVEAKGDMFEAAGAGDSLCHCVSADLAMGKGIAVEFKKRFGRVSELKQQTPAVGGGALLSRPGEPKAFVYYLVTKEKYWNKPQLAALRSSLEWMREHAAAHGVGRIVMPRIGCGLDGLRWEDVRALLAQVFGATAIKLAVFQL